MAAKLFEEGDVLPATTQLRISWVASLFDLIMSQIYTENDNFVLIDYFIDGEPGDYIKINNTFIIQNRSFKSPYTDYDGNHAYIDIDTSSWSLSKRTVSLVSNGKFSSIFRWQDLNVPQGFSVTFEENGGSTVTDLTDQTALPSPLPTTTKANNVFAGWYYDNLFTQKATAGDELTANVTLYAKWYTPTTWCEDIADAIREKDGSSGNIKHVDFVDRIRGLDTCIYLTQEEYDDITTPNENITYIIVEVE